MRRAGAFLQAARQAAIFIEEGDEVSECLGEEGAVVAGEKHVFSRAARTPRWRSAFVETARARNFKQGRILSSAQWFRIGRNGRAKCYSFLLTAAMPRS